MSMLSISTLRTPYLGDGISGGMIPLPKVASPITEPGQRGGSLTPLIGGGTSSVAFAKARRTFNYNFTDQTPEAADTVLGFWLGVRGAGPWMLVSPAWRNQLATDISSLGRRISAISGWSSSITAAAPTFDGAVVPAAMPSGVMRWAPSGPALLLEGTQVGATLHPNVGSITDAGSAVPRLSDQAQTVSIYARTESETAHIELRTYSLPAAGAASAASATSGSVTITSAGWTRLTCSLAAGVGLAVGYVAMGIYVSDGSPPPLLFSNPQHEIGLAKASSWVLGLGVPRVVLSSDNAFGSTVWDLRSQTFTASEI